MKILISLAVLVILIVHGLCNYRTTKRKADKLVEDVRQEIRR